MFIKMKKLIFTMLMAVSTVAVAMAEAQSAHQDNVACGQTVTMTATPQQHYKFDHWEMKDVDNVTTTYNVAGSGATYTCETDGATGVNTLSLQLSGGMIDKAISGNITFQAFFTEDSKFQVCATAVDMAGNTLAESDGKVTGCGSNYEGEQINLTAVAGSCYVFDHWETATGVSLGTDLTYTATVGPQDITLKAVFRQKTVNVYVTTDDNTMGTVAISVN